MCHFCCTISESSCQWPLDSENAAKRRSNREFHFCHPVFSSLHETTRLRVVFRKHSQSPEPHKILCTERSPEDRKLWEPVLRCKKCLMNPRSRGCYWNFANFFEGRVHSETGSWHRPKGHLRRARLITAEVGRNKSDISQSKFQPNWSPKAIKRRVMRVSSSWRPKSNMAEDGTPAWTYVHKWS